MFDDQHFFLDYSFKICEPKQNGKYESIHKNARSESEAGFISLTPEGT